MSTSVSTALVTDSEGNPGKRAATEAVAQLPGERVDFCQVFCPVEHDFERVLGGIRDVIGSDANLIGCSANGSFTQDAVGSGVAVGLVTSDTLSFYTGLGTGLRENVSRAVREAIGNLPEQVNDHPYAAAITLHDGLSGVGEKLALISQQKLGPEVSIAGGSAADDHQLEATYVFHDDEVVEDGVVMGLIGAQQRPVVAVEHGHEPLSEPVEVTRADGPIVHELDGDPAFEVWKDAVRETVSEEFDVRIDDLDASETLLQEILCEFEFGIDQGSQYKMRWPWIEDENGAMHFAVDIPDGTVLRVMHGRPDAQIESAGETVRRALQDAGDVTMAGGFIYDCACRGIVLGDEFETAVEEMARELSVPFVGFETYGEICMGPGQFSGYHNTTTVALLLPE
ncbi:hypothetical protein EA462_01770 [Natrarchaeobius halalkaliphilus]|uniref:Histidine kinase n=1 Tax=Natrarchaeobius halalkaliphilus TaxID=1679091 RepID=A0A3N6LSN0_9EURY|nr:FIST N-terminal domain-containing protein [Natrarchaeobius halalkaliphilus]RQG92968.1 hypothetical protein EA462_01770 [Natrarchaeobius halalkaliphilus]